MSALAFEPWPHYILQYFNGTSYIHNWSLQRFSQDYDLASHTKILRTLILYMRGEAAVKFRLRTTDF